LFYNNIAHYIWDIENKLIEVRKSGIIARYTYDALGRRIGKEVNGVTKQFRYDGEDLIMEMNSDDSITASYTFGPGIDNPLMMNRNDNNYYYLKDGLGSVTALTDSTSNIIKEYKYSVFGKIVEETGDSTLENPFTYTAREYDKETGNYYYRARYYSPEMGRFISEDRIRFSAGDINFYRYVFNNVSNFIDPFGLESDFCKIEENDPWKEEKKLLNQIVKDLKKIANDLPDILDYAKKMFPQQFEDEAMEIGAKSMSLIEQSQHQQNEVLRQMGLDTIRNAPGSITSDSAINLYKNVMKPLRK